jgi:hypothetical protein
MVEIRLFEHLQTLASRTVLHFPDFANCFALFIPNIRSPALLIGRRFDVH